MGTQERPGNDSAKARDFAGHISESSFHQILLEKILIAQEHHAVVLLRIHLGIPRIQNRVGSEEREETQSSRPGPQLLPAALHRWGIATAHRQVNSGSTKPPSLLQQNPKGPAWLLQSSCCCY